MRLADLCTLRVGGEARRFLLSTRRDELIQAIAQADAAREPLLFLGGGSNLVPVDGEFPGLVLRDGRKDVRVLTLQEFSELRAGVEQPSQGREPDTELRPDASRGIRDAAAVVAKAQQLAAATPSCVFLSVSGGLAWDRLVEFCVTQGFSGL